MSGCCNEHGCRRKHPILIRRAGFSGRWMAVTKYTKIGDAVVSQEKHELDDDTQGALERAFTRRDAAADLRDSTTKLHELMKHLGLDPWQRTASGHTFAQVLAAKALGVDVEEHEAERAS